ncbi:peptidoglycan DD-metalloendopeptidase family protein [Sphingomonas sp. MMS24-JH45]
MRRPRPRRRERRTSPCRTSYRETGSRRTTSPGSTRRSAYRRRSLPAPRPAWEVRPVDRDARAVEAQTYTVRPGDTLRAITEATGAGSEAIARVNALEPPFAIRAGQVLTIPEAATTSSAPARPASRSRVPMACQRWARMVAANALEEPYILRVGQRVLIPGDPDRRPSAAERAAAFTLDIDFILTGSQPAVAENRPVAKPVATPKRVLAATTPVVGTPPTPGRFAWPVPGTVVRRFGAAGTGQRSDGIKIAVPLGTPVKAVADGDVAYVGDGIAALGGLVIIRHGGGWASVYGHAGKLLVRRGQAVKKGETIALSGETGFADRPELHFELRRGTGTPA